MDREHVLHIVVAGGSGSRFGGDIPKQYRLLAGKPVIVHSIERLLPTGKVMVVIGANHRQLWDEIAAGYGMGDITAVTGGDTRWESVRNALRHCAGGERIITVHDAARPLVDAPLVARLLAAVEGGASAVIPVIPVTDSLRRTVEGTRTVSVPRSEYSAVQTPQAFEAQTLLEAYTHPYSPHMTDDASVVESCGGVVDCVEGSTHNMKITNSADILIAEALMSKWKG